MRAFFHFLQLTHVKTWASLAGKLAMSMQLSAREACPQHRHHIPHRHPLRLRPRILRRHPIRCTSADVAHSYRVGIMSRAVSASLLQRPALLHSAVPADHEVIPYPCPALSPVPPVDVGSAIVLALSRGRAMHDQFRNASHTNLIAHELTPSALAIAVNTVNAICNQSFQSFFIIKQF